MTIPFYRILEISLFSVLNFLPFMLLAIYPLRRHLRFSKYVTGVLIGFGCILQIAIGYFATFSYISSATASIGRTLFCAILLLSLMKDNVGRVFFVLLVFSNVSNLIVVFSKCLESQIFGDIALQPYRWTLCVCMIILHLFFTPPLVFYVRKYFTSGVPIHTTAWYYLWTVPATFYVIWFYHLYLTNDDSLSAAMDIHNAVFLLVINLGAFVIYHISVLLLLAQNKVHRMEHDAHIFATQKIQHDNLQRRINEARHARHDIRHHALMIREYLRSGKTKELEDYLDTYLEPLSDSPALVYCQHYETNMLLSYFVQLAQKQKIQMDVFVQLPESMEVPKTALSVILGNLLENAIDACSEISDGERKVTVRGKYKMSSVFFEISNTYSGNLSVTPSGKFVSTKSENRGLGLDSVAHIIETMGGVLEIETRNQIFTASVLLPEYKV